MSSGCWSLPFTEALLILIFMDDFLDPLSVGLGCEEHHSHLTWALLVDIGYLIVPQCTTALGPIHVISSGQ